MGYFNFTDNDILRVEVFGVDEEGNYYRLPVTDLAQDNFSMRTIVKVKLPFAPDHKIWPELHREENE